MTISIFSYGVAGLAYGLLTVLLLLSRQGAGRQGHWLPIATAGATAWGLAIAVILALAAAGEAIYAADALRSFLWTACLLAALPRGQGSRHLLLAAAGILATTAVLAPTLLQRAADAHLALLGMSVMGLLAVEQIFRNSTAEQRGVLKLFLWTVVVIFCYDLFVFSNAVLFGAIDIDLWALRGVVASLAVPFFLLAAKRHPDWQQTLFISRQIVFYSATLTGVGLYLIAMSLASVLIRQQGGEWGPLLQLGFFAAALAVLAAVLSSARLRMLTRVFISKHFYRNRYEYRDEWLRLIRTLSGPEAGTPLDQRGIKALAAIIGSTEGQLWLRHRATQAAYEPFAAWQAPFPSQEFSAESPLVSFLNKHQWVIDSEECRNDPERYDHAFSNPEQDLPPNSVIVPLMHQRDLLGFVRLARPRGLRTLNYEDHDLLKTAGRQVAAFLAHDLAREQLAETQQFEAFNKLSAFVMHDLKNLLAQQALLVENAKKHQHRPEFIADVISTVDNGVQRMRRLLQQIEQRNKVSPEQRIELSELVRRTVALCRADAARVILTETGDLWVRAQPDRLSSVIAHLIANAQEATAKDGTIFISMREHEETVVLEIRDSGEGMTEEFVRKRLFKPFVSTKGTSGMGIGVYQAREVVRSLGGDITVHSVVGEGTTVRLQLPIAHALPQEHQVSG